MGVISYTPDSAIVQKNKNKFCDWIKSLGYNPDEVYQVILILNENGLDKKVEIRQYKTDEEGNKYLNEDGNGIAKKEPATEDIDKLPNFLKRLN